MFYRIKCKGTPVLPDWSARITRKACVPHGPLPRVIRSLRFLFIIIIIIIDIYRHFFVLLVGAWHPIMIYYRPRMNHIYI